MSVENVPVVVNIKTLRERFVTTFLYWVGVGGGCGEEKKKSVADHFAIKKPLKNTKHSSVDLTNLAGCDLLKAD